MKDYINRIIIFIQYHLKVIFRKDEKIFIIGRNKTGTTSLKELLKNLGYVIGDQKTAELFIDDYVEGNFKNILNYCDSAEVFQDAPFSWPDTYKHVYKKYPHAKFILLERENSLVWFESLQNFHRKIVNNGQPVSAEDLKKYFYRKKGFLWQVQQVVYNIDEATLYDKDIYIANYESYNKEVKDFFKGNSNFISLILSDGLSTNKIARFLGKNLDKIKIPHLNKT